MPRSPVCPRCGSVDDKEAPSLGPCSLRRTGCLAPASFVPVPSSLCPLRRSSPREGLLKRRGTHVCSGEGERTRSSPPRGRAVRSRGTDAGVSAPGGKPPLFPTRRGRPSRDKTALLVQQSGEVGAQPPRWGGWGGSASVRGVGTW